MGDGIVVETVESDFFVVGLFVESVAACLTESVACTVAVHIAVCLQVCSNKGVMGDYFLNSIGMNTVAVKAFVHMLCVFSHFLIAAFESLPCHV